MGWHKKPFQYRSKEFLFRGMLKCAVTGNLITSDTKSKEYKNGEISEWTYELGVQKILKKLFW